MASQTSSAVPDAHSIDNTAAGGHATTHEGAEGHGGGGLPQLEMQHWGGQIVWLLLIFVVLYTLLAKVFLPRLRAVQDQRTQTISAAVETARQVQDEAAEQAAFAKADLEQARATSRRVAAEAKARVAAEAAERAAVQEAEVNAKITTAEAAIAKSRDVAMSNVSAIATEAAGAIVERLTGNAATAAELKGAA